MNKNTQKNYYQIDNKIKNNFEDAKYLIGIYHQVLNEIKLINQRMDRMQNSIDSMYED